MSFLNQIYKGKTDWWRWLFVLVIFVPFPFRNYLKEALQPFFKWLPIAKENSLITELSVYLIVLPLLILIFRFIHQRNFFTLVTVRKEFDWVRFLLSFATWGIFIVVVLLTTIVLGKGEEVIWNIKI